ncbi:MAG: hypothetical protein HKN11_07660 [Rhizobiales bacterium]|nr:hypothetical protein [Hyphomicrobiales bacterium]
MSKSVTPKQSYLTLRHEDWHIRLAVPADVQATVGRPALQKSLHTTCMDTAAERARIILVQWQAEFDVARRTSGLGWRPAEISNDNILPFPGRCRA